jgi:putative transposase
MKYKLDKGSHSVYCIQFHLVICTKYRRKVLQGEIDERLKYWVREVFAHFGLELIQQETDQDHLHIVFGMSPACGPLSRFVNSLKSTTARRLRQEFPRLKSDVRRDAFWSRSYFVASIGQVRLEDVKRYVETQRDK